ncbi:micronuclear linker histone polyprotein-like isoform X2 [Linepithema humile]|uniref:micronuclear linker histone polyprotein-like isoform X2 n=1 Tax=Linepithema humile TaxID=83485 RepID=UPI00351E97D4
MPRQYRDSKYIVNKRRLTTHKNKKEEEDSRSSSTSNQNSLKNSVASQNKKVEKRAKSKNNSTDNSKNSKKLFSKSGNCKNEKCQASQLTSESSTSTYPSRKIRTRVTNAKSVEPNKFDQTSGNSWNYAKRICTCGKGHSHAREGNSHEHANSRSASEERCRKRKRSRRRRKKASKRESNRPRHDCFTTLCICIRGRSLDELRTCKCMSSREILSSRHRCCCTKSGQKGMNGLTPRGVSKSDTQVDGHIADPSTSERKPALKQPRKSPPAKPQKERNVIIGWLRAVRRRIDRFSAHAIRLFTGDKSVVI